MLCYYEPVTHNQTIDMCYLSSPKLKSLVTDSTNETLH